MQSKPLQAIYAKAIQTKKVTPNLLNRKFQVYGARIVLLTDITYVPRGEGKYSYLSVIMDAFTKQVHAHVLSTSFEVDFILLTVQQFMDKRIEDETEQTREFLFKRSKSGIDLDKVNEQYNKYIAILDGLHRERQEINSKIALCAAKKARLRVF